ncbi:MAG: phasin family protein [Alphaproteobacteria bacterium]
MSKSKKNAGITDTTSAKLPMMEIQPLMSANAQSFKAMAQAQEHMLRRMATFNRELFKFIDRRLEHDRKTVLEIASCNTPEDVYTACSKFFESSASHYSDEMEALASLYTEQANEVMEDTRHQMEESAAQAGSITGNG